MAYLVRKLFKRENIEKIGESDNIDTMFADGPVGEFRTTDGTLSTWIIESLDKLEDAILAIVVTSTDVSKMDFVIIDTDILDVNGLDYKQTYAGQEIAVPDLQNTHYDIVGITLHKLFNCTKVFKSIYQNDNNDETYIVRYAAGEIKDLLNKANSENRLDLTILNPKMQKYLTA